jgi:hypothetical protein
MKCFFQRLWSSRRWRLSIIILVVGIGGIFAYDMANENGRLISERIYLDCAAWQMVKKTVIFGLVVSEERAEKLPFSEMARSFTPSLGGDEIIVGVRPLSPLKSRFKHGRLLGSISDLKQLDVMLQVEPENRDDVEEEVAHVLASMHRSIELIRKPEK